MLIHISLCGTALILIGITMVTLISQKRRYYFQSRGIPYLGDVSVNCGRQYFDGKGSVEIFASFYNKFKHTQAPFAGFCLSIYKCIMVRDPTLLKRIMVQDASHFDRTSGQNLLKGDAYLSKMLIMLQEQDWKNARVKLDSGFTPSKINRSFPKVNNVAEDLITYLNKHGENLDFLHVTHKFALDASASVAMSIKTNCLKQKEPSIFEQISSQLYISFEKPYIFKPLFIMVFSSIAKYFRISVAPKCLTSFYEDVISQRKQDPVKLDSNRILDFIDLLDSAATELYPNHPELRYKDDWITGNLTQLIAAGYETTQITIAMSAYLLALHPQVQAKLRLEINRVADQDGGQITCDGLKEMSYLAMVVNETLRMYPALGLTVRTCKKEYTVPGTEVVLQPGDMMFLPLMGLHYDEEHFENPKEFRPERFGEGQKDKIHPFAYQPFGHGPRSCIAGKMGLQQVKIAVCHLVKNFQIDPCEGTLIPMEFRSALFATLIPKEVRLSFHQINRTAD